MSIFLKERCEKILSIIIINFKTILVESKEFRKYLSFYFELCLDGNKLLRSSEGLNK